MRSRLLPTSFPLLSILLGGGLLCGGLIGCAPGVMTEDPTTPPAGFRPLFDGTSLSGWWGLSTVDPRSIAALSPEARERRRQESLANIRAHWSVEDGILVNDGEGLFLTTEEEFGDFELRLEYRTVAGADSGIYLRGIPQVQIWDTTEAGGKWELGANLGSGGLWNNPPGTPGRDPLVHADRPFGEWNRVRVVMVGSRVTVELNGRTVVDHAILSNYFDRERAVPARGPIQLQTHGGRIEWRRIWVREIEAEEANARLLRCEDDPRSAWASLFDGTSLAGWRGATEGYEVRDGALSCRKGSGGTLHHSRMLEDFELSLEFRLPPGGNNGLAIRYPGVGDPAYSGMCELQVLDSTHPKYAGLDPRQHHGSAYGRAAAQRGYLRPAGEWNHQWVRVAGTRIQVELNGAPILDTDLSRIEDGLAPIEQYAGRDRRSGHFGLAGHNDAVEYRRIRVRDLPVRDGGGPE